MIMADEVHAASIFHSFKKNVKFETPFTLSNNCRYFYSCVTPNIASKWICAKWQIAKTPIIACRALPVSPSRTYSSCRRYSRTTRVVNCRSVGSAFEAALLNSPGCHLLLLEPSFPASIISVTVSELMTGIPPFNLSWLKYFSLTCCANRFSLIGHHGYMTREAIWRRDLGGRGGSLKTGWIFMRWGLKEWNFLPITSWKIQTNEDSSRICNLLNGVWVMARTLSNEFYSIFFEVFRWVYEIFVL